VHLGQLIWLEWVGRVIEREVDRAGGVGVDQRRVLGYLTRSSSWLIGAKPAGTSTCTVPPSNTFGVSASAGWANAGSVSVNEIRKATSTRIDPGS